MASRVRSEEKTAYNADPTFSKKEDDKLIAMALSP